MTESEGLKIMAMLRGVWGTKNLDADAVRVWPALLADLGYDDVHAAVTRLAKTSKWLPTVAEIRGEVVEERCALPEPELAWGLVLKAVSRFGSYRKPVFEHEELAQAVDAIGWQNICLDENVAATRARLIDAYRAARARRLELEATGRYVGPDRRLGDRRQGQLTSGDVTAEEAGNVVDMLAAKLGAK